MSPPETNDRLIEFEGLRLEIPPGAEKCGFSQDKDGKWHWRVFGHICPVSEMLKIGHSWPYGRQMSYVARGLWLDEMDRIQAARHFDDSKETPDYAYLRAEHWRKAGSPGRGG